MKPYPEYKPSGIAWLGNIPSHWDIRRIKEVCCVLPSNIDKLAIEGQVPVALCNYVDVYKNERITRNIAFMKATASLQQIERLGLKKGDVVITKDSESRWDIAVPSLIYEDIGGLVCGYHLARLEPIKIIGCYLAWCLRCYQIKLYFSLYASGITRYGLSTRALSDGRIPVPSLHEQQAIADYLDTETARIDELIREKEDLIRLMQEFRQTVASDAVMRGLDDSCGFQKMEGGFGDIPSHWRMIPLKRFVTVTGGHTPSTDNADYWDGDIPWVSPKDMKSELISGSIDHITRAAVVGCGLTLVPTDSTLVVVRGMILAHSFPVAQNTVTVTINQDMKALFPVTDVLPGYLPWLLRGVTPIILSYKDQSAHGTLALRSEKLFGEPLPIPPLEEQAKIMERLADKLSRIDALITHTRDEIRLLRELRAATIADAVLGRIDVRDAGRDAAAVGQSAPVSVSSVAS